MIRQVPGNKLFKLFPIFSVILLDEIAITIGFPVLTFLCFDQHSTLFAASVSHMTRSFWFGVCSASPSLIGIASSPILGFISDRFGRKPILILAAMSALLLCVFTTLSIFFGAILLLVVGSIISGFCARIQPVALAVVSDLSELQQKITNMGYLQLSISIGACIGPLLGGYFAQRFFFQKLNFSVPYLLGSIIAIITLILTIKYFCESYQAIKYKTISFRELLNPAVIQISIVLALTQVSWRIYYQFIPPILKLNFHYAASTIGIFIALVAVWLSLAAACGVRLLNRYFSISQIIKYACYVEVSGLVLASIGCLLPPNLLGQLVIWISAIPIAMADVVIFCAITTLYSEAVSQHHQGKVMGLCFVVVSAVWALTGILGGLLSGINVILPILLAPLTIVLMVIFSGRFLNFSKLLVKC